MAGSVKTDRYHYYLAGQQIATRVQVQHQAGTFYYIFTDRLGSVAAMRQGEGSWVSGNHARYDAFGGYRTKPNHTVNPGISDRGYTGRRMNKTGLDDLGLIYPTCAAGQRPLLCAGGGPLCQSGYDCAGSGESAELQ